MANNTPATTAQPTSALALVKTNVVDIVANKVRQFEESGELAFPASYSPENAMKSAWLMLQDVKTKEGKPALTACSENSIANSLLSMVVQGLNVDKKQCYFIPYGNALTLQRSYFGTIAVAKRVDESIEDVFAEIVYEGDVFKYKIERGQKVITNHEQDLDNVTGKKIKAAYCIVVDVNGQVKKTDIMTFDEIKQAWKQSKMNPVEANGNIKTGSTHDKFTADMAKKTVINRCLKPIINSSDDSSLLMKHVRASDDSITEAEVAEEIETHANGEVLDISMAEEAQTLDDKFTDVVLEDEPVAAQTRAPGF